jgi:LDH2 family malate/lactate/ureidoglycolate dehydrogenase
MDGFLREIRQQPRMPGADRIYVPGELEFEARQKAWRTA